MGEEQLRLEEQKKEKQNNEEQKNEKNKDAEMKVEEAVSVDNIYKLDGRVPVWKAIPFGLQHVLAMFVANLAPIAIIAEVASPELTQNQVGKIISNAMFVAGLATLIQLYPLWKIGARLPIVMGVSFTFVTILSTIGANYGYPVVIGSVLVGGLVEGTIGLLVKRLAKFIKPIVSATVVCGIGLSLFTVGIRYFGGGYTEDFGSPENLIVGTITLLVSIIWMVSMKGYLKALSVLVAMIVGYIVAVSLGMVDLSYVTSSRFTSIPDFLMFTPEFKIGPILSVIVIFFVSAAETIGDTSAMVSGGLNREVKDREISGSIASDGYMSSVSALFGCPPVTSFSQNVGLIAMTKVVNRFTIMTGAVIMMFAGCFPIVGNFFATMPQAVLGGCTVMMFGQIFMSGIKMLSNCGFTSKNTTIAALSLSIGVGATAASESEIWHVFPPIIRDVFGANVVAVIFVIAMILSYALPESMDEE